MDIPRYKLKKRDIFLLQDILENDDIYLDLNFKVSLTMDLVHVS